MHHKEEKIWNIFPDEDGEGLAGAVVGHLVHDQSKLLQALLDVALQLVLQGRGDDLGD